MLAAGSANNATSARGCAEPRRAERSPQCAWGKQSWW